MQIFRYLIIPCIFCICGVMVLRFVFKKNTPNTYFPWRWISVACLFATFCYMFPIYSNDLFSVYKSKFYADFFFGKLIFSISLCLITILVGFIGLSAVLFFVTKLPQNKRYHSKRSILLVLSIVPLFYYFQGILGNKYIYLNDSDLSNANLLMSYSIIFFAIFFFIFLLWTIIQDITSHDIPAN